MIVLRVLLYPFSVLYDLVTRLRNYLFDIGHKRSFRFETIVISVGNLNVGGSGKTPMIEYIISLLSPSFRLATLSRGYGRKTRGFRMATSGDSAETLGDEPFQFFRKFKDKVLVAVGEDRVFAIPHILQQEPEPDVILLDDAYQHRPVLPQLSILLTEFSLPFYRDFLLPMGRLRESRQGAKRCDAVVITKCPEDIDALQMDQMVDEIRKYATGKPVFFSKLNYEAPIPFGGSRDCLTRVVLVSGIANNKLLEDFVRSRYHLVRHFSFRDHYPYTFQDVKSIVDFCRQSAEPVSILTTEKDMVKLASGSFQNLVDSFAWFYLPISISFIKNGSEFDRLIHNAIEEMKASQ